MLCCIMHSSHTLICNSSRTVCYPLPCAVTAPSSRGQQVVCQVSRRCNHTHHKPTLCNAVPLTLGCLDWSNRKPYCSSGCRVQLEQPSRFFARTSNWQLQLLQCWRAFCSADSLPLDFMNPTAHWNAGFSQKSQPASLPAL
jgi:hypothetical protein